MTGVEDRTGRKSGKQGSQNQGMMNSGELSKQRSFLSSVSLVNPDPLLPGPADTQSSLSWVSSARHQFPLSHKNLAFSSSYALRRTQFIDTSNTLLLCCPCFAPAAITLALTPPSVPISRSHISCLCSNCAHLMPRAFHYPFHRKLRLNPTNSVASQPTITSAPSL